MLAAAAAAGAAAWRCSGVMSDDVLINQTPFSTTLKSTDTPNGEQSSELGDPDVTKILLFCDRETGPQW